MQIFECRHPSAQNGIPRLKHSINALEKFCSDGQTLDAPTKSHLNFVFTMFNKLVEDSPLTFQDNGYRRVKTFAPIELVAVSVLISQYGDKRPMGLLKGDILALRDQLRHKQVDLKMHERCWADAWDYIDDLERHRGTVDNSTVSKSRSTRAQRIGSKKMDALLMKIVTSPKEVPAPKPVQASKTGRASPPKRATKGRPQVEGETPSENEMELDEESTGSHSNSSIVVPLRNLPAQAPATNTTRPREAQRLASYTMKIEKEDAQRAMNEQRRLSGSSSGDSLIAAVAPMAVMAGPTAKKRTNLEFDVNSASANALAAKKARLLAKRGKE